MNHEARVGRVFCQVPHEIEKLLFPKRHVDSGAISAVTQ